MDVNLINKKKDPMKPPSTISNMIDDHHNGDHNDHHHGHFVPSFVQKSHMDLSDDVLDPVDPDEDLDVDDDIRAAMISIMSSQAAAAATTTSANGFQNDDDHDHNHQTQDDEDYPNNHNIRPDPGVRIRSSPSSTSSSPPPPTSSFNLKQSQNDYIIIIDDLFVRKLLHQICPEHFDETWLQRFKSQYLNSFLLNDNNNHDTNKPENANEQEEQTDDEKEEEKKEEGSGDYRSRKQKRILEQILSTNQLTANDEFLVYWKLDHHHQQQQQQQQQQQHCHHDRDMFQNLNCGDPPEPEESWLQHRDPMTYLYNFCELLMFLEMKFDGQKQKDRCQQLAREIRAYLYWISNDGRFKEDSVEQEQLARMACKSSSSSSSLTEPNLDSGAEQRLFYSIVQHLLMICYELMMTTTTTTTAPTAMVEEFHRNKQKKRFYQVFEGYFGRSSLNDPPKSSNLTLYEQWMKNLKHILISLVDYYELNPQIKLQQQQQQLFDCNDHHHQPPSQPQLEPNEHHHDHVAMLTTAAAAAAASSSSIDPATVMASASSSAAAVTKYFDQQQHQQPPEQYPNGSNLCGNSGGGGGSGLIVPASQSSQSPPSSSSSSSSLSTTTAATSSIISSSHHFNHLMAPLSSPSSATSSMAQNNSSNNNHNHHNHHHQHHHHNGTSSTNVERHSSTTSSSGPSSGVGSFDSSVHHSSSSSFHRDLFMAGGQQKFHLPSSASMAPSPANFTNATSPLTTTTTTTEDNNFSMLLQLNQLDDLDGLMDPNPNPQLNDPQRIPKLIAPAMIQRNNGVPSPTTFGFDFNSLNNPNRKEKNRQPEPITFNQNAEFVFRNQPTVTNSNGPADHHQTAVDQNPTNGSLFHDLNITSLFSSFDDNISIGAESATITDFNPLATASNHHNNSSINNGVGSSLAGSLAIKHYPDPDQESGSIQLPNQCFTMTLDHQPKHGFGHHHPAAQQQQQQQSAAIPKPLVLVQPKYGHGSSCPPLNTPPLIQQPQPLQHQTSAQESVAAMDELCERQTLYRLIISQLLFDGHRAIACQVAGSEHIKCDSFLIGPSQELHKLVTFAKAKKKEDILMDKSLDPAAGAALNVTPGFGRANSSGYFDSAVGGSHSNTNGGSPTQTSPAMLAASQQTSPFSLRVEDPYSKAIYDHHHSMGSHLNFGATSNGSQQQQQQISNSHSAGASISITSHTSTSTQNSTSMLDYGDLNSSATDLYSPSSGQMEYYFHSNRSPDMQNMNSPFSNNNNSSSKTSPPSHGLNDGRQLMVGGGGGGARGGSMKCLAPPMEPPSSAHPLANVGNELVLTEACLKNINQLAKLNSSGLEPSLTNPNNPLLGTGPSGGQPIMFGRSASAMAMTTPNGMNMNMANNNSVVAPGPIGSNTTAGNGNISRSPLPIKSPTAGYPANHTTGNGKSHQIMQIVYKFGSLGQLKSQFSSPHGFCLGMNDEIIIADTNNHRICSYDKNGVFKQMFGNPGKDEGQLWYPRKITMIPQNYVRNTVNSPYFVICDRGMERSRMQIFTRNGNFVRKIPIRYIDIVAGIAINNRGHIVVVDSVSPTIYVITIDNGTLIEWRDCGDYMREPSDVAIYDDDYYICDFKGHCVVVIKSNGDFVRKIGMEGLTSFPNGIDISPAGDIFVGDSHGNKFHVVVFNRDGRLLAEYECPYCKVSRCCGLKLTKDNCIVTLAKNNHHVLVLNPNFPPSQPSQLLQLQQQQSPSQQQQL